MRSNNILGLIFSNINDDKIPELTAKRTMGSVPVGGKYRMIDFPLSNMTNSGINNVGIVARNNYLSLMDHVGTGAAWDLSKRHSGLTVLPPVGTNSSLNKVETIYSIRGYINHCQEEYVLMCSSDFVASVDYQKAFYEHMKTGADITIMYKYMQIPAKRTNPVVLSFDVNKRITELLIKPGADDNYYNMATGTIIIKKDLLLQLIEGCVSSNRLNFNRDVLQANVDKLKICGYEIEGYCRFINSTADYFDVNMSLMDANVRAQLFNSDHPIYTKVRDDMPSRYGLGSHVKNSLVAQGCVIDGEVENCIISKGVCIAKGAKIKNCVIMQDSKIGPNTNLNYVIIDKDVEVKEGRNLMGFVTCPTYIPKQSIV